MWDQRYSESGFVYGTDPNDFLVEATHHLPTGGEVLSLGEGEGRNAVFLARRGFHVTALDQSPVGLAKARELAAQSGVQVHTVVANLASHDLGADRWDGIVSIWCHLPSSLRVPLHRAVTSALRRGGAFILEAYTPDQLQYRTGGPSDPDMLPTLAGLRDELAGLDLLLGEEKVREVHEGRLHGGTSAVVQVVARKR